ncbi:beta-ketoacyl-[acyl-carrier-protein] synthase family protein [Rhizosphaericola mali]|uniref:3-oxoacyl-[acyl-carrier-protein] synthase 1 n=1 Tax=Rhizosphaericola mali TaxID=2545455 RepID=A0A5P2GF94_9BACT|nr:beta-ketoacyl-[acyl-carrier-protein] synthase family protein [Rhizosphaericola mali]QES90281.1 beta-ketoacyl-[acyl-carrier-protein] synthase family protein [Rhizosphaericola mali]
MKQRVVITGMGVVSPNGIGLKAFAKSLKIGKSGIKKIKEMRDLNLRCQVAGVPPISQKKIQAFLSKYNLRDIISTGVIYGCMSAVEAWLDAGLEISDKALDRSTGCIFGTGSNGAEATQLAIDLYDAGKGVKKTPKNIFMQSIASCVSIYINGIFGLGNHVTTNSSACSTGTEGILEGYYRIVHGEAERMIIGSSESAGTFVWTPFDAMFATAQDHNHHPKEASCPLNQNASGFVPGAGGGALILESLASAQKRGAKIYAEILGGHINSGGQRRDGSMTIGNSEGMIRCIENAVKNCKIKVKDLDLISGHLTSTIGDIVEMQCWDYVFKRHKISFEKRPYINATKSMIGHSLSASGSIESIAAILQMNQNFVHPSINAYPLHENIEGIFPHEKIPKTVIENINLNTIAKISFGFGDVNACVIFQKYKS